MDHSAALRSGLLALRLGELRADPDFSEALSSLREAAKRASTGRNRGTPWDSPRKGGAYGRCRTDLILAVAWG